jgi:Transposase DDE domain
MHTHSVLQKFFRVSLPTVHQHRRDTIVAAVDSVAQGATVSITAMGRRLSAATRIKHRVKRMDRLIGNPRLHGERDQFYHAMIQRLLAHCTRPILVIDWSDFSDDRQQQLLRAVLPVGGRGLTLYEELHPYAKLANRCVQHRFLDRLKRLLPLGCTPIIIADAGFRVPFFRYVERLGWDWLGRIRNRDYVRWEGAPQDWIPAKSLYALATPRAQVLGTADWVRRAPLAGRLIVIRHPQQGRKDCTLAGTARRSRLSRKHAQQVREPWLLIAAPSLADLTPRQIVRLYKTRMQIEENFRDTKSLAYGLGIARGCHTTLARATNLLLIAALAIFVLWMIGCLAKARHWDRAVRVNSSSQHADYSALTLARLVIHHLQERLPVDCFETAGQLAADYFQSVLEI